MNRRVGFVGLGFMGRGMAANMAKGLSKLTVFDISPENSKIFRRNCEAEGREVVFAESLRHLAEESDIVCLSLPSESSCKEVIFGGSGIAQTWKSSKEGKLIIDHCTSSKAFAQETHLQLSSINNLLSYVDSPVSGGPGGARDATLTIMVGGKKQHFDDCLPLFRLIGKKILHFGPAGSGMAAKLVNNALVTAHAQCAAEALLMAERLDLLDRNENVQNLFDMLKSSWGQSKVLELVGNDYLAVREQIAEYSENEYLQNFPTQAPLRNLKKDMNCVIHDLRHSLADSEDRVRRSFPIFQTTFDCVDRACSGKEMNLSDSPFASLLIPIRKEASKPTGGEGC